MLTVAALATFLSLLTPIVAYTLLPPLDAAGAQALPDTAGQRHPLASGIVAAKESRGHVTLEGVLLAGGSAGGWERHGHHPGPGPWRHVGVLETGGGRVLVVLTGCWADGRGRLYMPWEVLGLLSGSRVAVHGLLVETSRGPALLAVEIRGSTLELHRVQCAEHRMWRP